MFFFKHIMTEVSVVIPTKNEEKQIKITLNHLLRQSFEDFEIIVSDGNSEDNTKNVVEEFIPKFRQRKINLSFVTTSKKGVSEGRNYGAKKARGKYIYFFDADVYPVKDFIRDTLFEFKKKRLSLATTKSQGNDKKLKNIAYYKFINRSIRILQYTPYPAAAGYCIISSKTAFNKIGGFDPEIYLAEDTTYILRGRRKKFRFRILKSHPIKVSNRRLNSEGTATVLAKYILCSLFLVVKQRGPKRGVAQKLLKYEMGTGDYTKKQKLSKRLIEFIKKL